MGFGLGFGAVCRLPLMVQMVSVPPVSVPLVPVPPPMSMPQVSVAELLDLVPTCSVNSIPLSSQTQFPDALEADSATEMVLTDGQKRLLGLRKPHQGLIATAQVQVRVQVLAQVQRGEVA